MILSRCASRVLAVSEACPNVEVGGRSCEVEEAVHRIFNEEIKFRRQTSRWCGILALVHGNPKSAIIRPRQTQCVIVSKTSECLGRLLSCCTRPLPLSCRRQKQERRGQHRTHVTDRVTHTRRMTRYSANERRCNRIFMRRAGQALGRVAYSRRNKRFTSPGLTSDAATWCRGQASFRSSIKVHLWFDIDLPPQTQQ